MQHQRTSPWTAVGFGGAPVGRLGRILRPYAPHMALVLGMLIVLALVNMAVPAIVGVLFNQVFEHRLWTLLWLLLGGILVVYLVRNVLYWATKYRSVYVGEQISFELRKELFERLQRQNLRFYKDRNPGELSSRVMDDSFVIQTFIQDELPKLLQSACLFVGLVAVLYVINWPLALAATVVLPLHLAAFRYFRGPIRQSSRAAQQHLAEAHGTLIERFLAMEVVKGFTAEERENAAFVRAIDSSRASQLASKKFHMLQKIAADLLVGLGTIALLGCGGYQVMKEAPDAMQPGTFIAFFGYVGMLYPTVVALMSGSAKLTRAGASIDRIGEMLRTPRSEERIARPVVAPIHGQITFEDVDVGFDDGRTVLRDVNLEIPAGGVCVITGPSGSGKTTLLSLIPRFLEPTYGRLLIDGVDAARIKTRHLRRSIGIAFQEAFLFNATVLENLRYANPEATMWQIINVARRTGAHGLISRLPHGYHTMLGENGVNLSRGEKQRLVLTRALLKDPQILILDEATASIDPSSQARIIPAVLELMRGRTVLMATHRPEMMRYADTVVRLEAGRVTYTGPPPEAPRPHVRPQRSAGGVVATLMAIAVVLLGLLGSPAAAQQPAREPAVSAVGGLSERFTPNPEGGFFALGGLDETAVKEMLDVLTTRAQAEWGYRPADEAQAARLPQPPTPLTASTVLGRREGEALKLLQFGYRLYQTQPPHVWVFGRSVVGEELRANPDVPRAVQLVRRARSEIVTTPRDAAVATISLSYIGAEQCVQMLQSFGYTVLQPGTAVDPANLPAVMKMPETDNTGLVGGAQGGAADPAKYMGISLVPGTALDIPSQTDAGPLMQLLVFYHPAHPQQLSALRRRIREDIDVPARQLLIEAMVLEISSRGLEKLGVEWELSAASGNIESLKLGRLPEFSERDNEVPTVEAELSDVFGEFGVRLEALIRENEAEILSRPSVLTLDGRQASIRVGEDIPIAKSFRGATGGDIVQLDFAYIPTGILLNVRPRISSEGRQVSLQIDGIVSAEVPGEDLIIRAEPKQNGQLGQELGRAPRISTRRIQAHTRIANNTPFIIGGLVSKDNVREIDKVPLLGDIPIIKHAFRSTRIDNLKREVIIVITPFVLPEGQLVGRNLPKDEDAFDSFGNELFRDAYRIRAEDVFDLTFVEQNRQLRRMQALADRVAIEDPMAAERHPFDRFTGGRIPGEPILVYRQMYEVIKRLGTDRNISGGNIIFFHPDETSAAGFSVTFLERFLARKLGPPGGEAAAAGDSAEDRLRAMLGELQRRGMALAMVYTQRADDDIVAALEQPVPQIKLVALPEEGPDGRPQWGQKLWEMNQPGPDGLDRYTILLQTEADMTRLKRALVLKRTVQLNATRGDLTLDNFSLGRQLLMPTVKEDKIYLIDSDTARYFFLTEHYYAAFTRQLAAHSRDLIEALGARGGPLRQEADPGTPQPSIDPPR